MKKLKFMSLENMVSQFEKKASSTLPIGGSIKFEVDGQGILIIDDLVDSGRTLEIVRKMYPKAHFATVYAKPKGHPMVDTFITEVSQDTWIFFPWDMALQYVEPYRGN